ncbi:tRNA pseudouridine synthase B [Chitinispirillum alkaliphilum]|nr:tRNA pseudouridine synthase B [Chitinispirillum alkaliphilum]
MDGFLCIDKPLGPSSFAVTSEVRKKLGIKKIGHAGTLDPYASGLLVLALGKYTRLIQYLPAEPKIYVFSVLFGFTTDTLDLEGKVSQSKGAIPGEKSLELALETFAGEQLQVPPLYSAVKVNGTRAYKLARSGSEVQLKGRKITIHSLRLIDYNQSGGEAQLELVCSGGTYVRSVARDLAEKLGTFGVVSKLRRTAAGVFSVDHAVKPENLSAGENYIISSAKVFRDFSHTVTQEEKEILKTGRNIDLPHNSIKKGHLFAFDQSGKLVAVLKPQNDQLHPEKVFI